MNYPAILRSVEDYAINTLENTAIAQLPYHNRKHTESVVNNAGQLADHYQLSEHDRFIVQVACWMHDLGYSAGRDNHEETGVEMAKHFLEPFGLPPADIEAISNCIRATKLPQQPTNLLEEIVCDADLFHLGTTYFPEANKLIRKEFEMVKHQKIDKDEFRMKATQMLDKYQFHTDYARAMLNEQKNRNLEELKEKSRKSLAKQNESSPPSMQAGSGTATDQLKNISENHHEVKPGKVKDNRPERGVETMFRVSSSNHQRLSDMADNKSQIMITVNSIILSAVISLLLRKLDDTSYLMIPTFMLLGTSLVTIIFAILATRPSIPDGRFTKSDVENKKVNLLFFGNFYRMPLSDYKEGMEKVIEDKDYVYGSLIMDGYAQGRVLGKKYQLLRISYNVFMFGLILSVAAFIIASGFYAK